MALFKGTKLTPEQRRQKLEAARKAEAEAQRLLQEAEQEDTIPVTKPLTTSAGQPSLLQTKQGASTAQVATNPMVPASVRANETGPGGDTRKSGQPSLLQTMKQVWQNVRNKPTYRSTITPKVKK